MGPYEAPVTTGREAFRRLKEAAGAYGALLEVLHSHKWRHILLATDKGLRAEYKRVVKNIDIFDNIIVIADVEMRLRLYSTSLYAEYYTRDCEKAVETAEKLRAAGLRPNVVKEPHHYTVYITLTDLLRLAEEDPQIRAKIAQYLLHKIESGTPRQREIVAKTLGRHF